MPVRVAERGGKYCVVDPNGKLTGKCYSTKEEAVKQVQAINLSLKRQKSKSAIDLLASDRIRIMASELQAGHGAEDVPIKILTDGSADGTMLMVHDQVVPFSRLELYCSQDPDYPNCEMTLVTKLEGEDGVEVQKTLRLRKQPDKVESARKPDPGAKVRNRGDVVFSANSKNVTDNKDHFPINDADQARNALSRVAQYSASPKWYKGSLKQLQSTVRSAVKRKFKNINVTEANCKDGFALFYATGSFRWLRRR